jgi:probable addiction module antidote protein
METREFRVEGPEAVAAYLDEAFATGDPAFIMAAMTDVLKCRVVSEVAEKANVNRVSLHKALVE